MFSRRLPPFDQTNAISRVLDALRAAGTPFINLTESNPTRVGLAYPDDLLAPLADPQSLRYDPDPRGRAETRHAIAADMRRRGAVVDPDHIVLCASTSEAYSWLFKLLCDPGTAVAVPRPSYPLFEHLTRLDGVETVPYHLEFHGRWELDIASLAAAPAETRAVLVVSPNNPTGSFVTAREIERVVALCREREWALIVDEVFADYPLEAPDVVTDIAATAGVLTFTLGGASKQLALPQVKLGWIVVGGPAAARDQALRRLELIADTYLSVSTPVQVAGTQLLERGSQIRSAVQQRLRGNLELARETARAFPACTVLPVEGGWSMVVRVPATG